MNDFKERLKAEQTNRKLNQKEFAKFLGVTATTLRRIEAGGNSTEEVITKIVKALGWSDGIYSAYLYGVSDKEKDELFARFGERTESWGLTFEQASPAMGVSHNTLYTWRSKGIKAYGKRKLLEFLAMDKETFEQTAERNQLRIERQKKATEDPFEFEEPKQVEIDAEELRKLRKEHGYSQYKLAEKLNVTQSTISHWELGGTIPEDRMVILRRVFDIPIVAKRRRPKRTEAEWKAKRAERKKLLNYLDLKYDGQLSKAPDDCPLLNEYRELVGA